MGKSIWVYLQKEGESLVEESLMGLSVGANLAKESSATLEAVIVGEMPAALPKVPGKIYRLQGEDLQGGYDTACYGRAMEFLCEREKPLLVIFPSTTQGQDLASWLGSREGGAALVGATDVRFGEEGFVATRLEFEGRVAVEYQLDGSPTAISLEQGVGDLSEVGQHGQAEVVEVDVPGVAEGRVRTIYSSGGTRKVDLRSAKAIVAVGAGVGGKEGFEQVRALASILGAELGATRAAVDAGWLGHEHQIGQTGVKVKPELYVACGISGAVQHRVGMLDSGTVVSINLDPQAPIFRFSHYCVVGDVREVIPKLLELLRR